MRVFISIDIETPEILEKINLVAHDLKRSGALIKLVEPENIHATLKFLGEVDPKDIEAIYQKVDESCENFKSFNMTLQGLGAFPNPKYPRVVWIGVSDGAKEAEILANRISRNLESLGFKPEKRPFTPHITIARVKRGNASLKGIIEKHRDHQFGSFRVTEVRVKKSKLTPQGPIYTTLYSRKLD
ncbi:MAG: RNA 2',3'-cyclic phosphodiesterase [Candidatus Njordarchaeia archaeon]